MAGLLPALLLALFGTWCGTFAWGAAAPAGAAAAVAVLGTLFWIGVPWRDPLRLGGSGRLLPAALWIGAAASAWASPVPRAGWVAVVLLPAFLALPAAVSRCWRREADRRRGLRAVALIVAGCALWSLVDWLVLGAPRPAMPLGHHNLLAAWLAILLPLAVLPAREPGPWRFAGTAAGALSVVAIAASRSLAGIVAVAAMALLGTLARGRRSGRRPGFGLLVLALVLTALLFQLPRGLRIAAGADSSARARAAYLSAGWKGFTARPLLGWGPGSAPWTAAAFLDPVPGVDPWGETVGELHSLPMQLGYELGITGALLAAALLALFAVRRLGERQEGRDPGLLAAGLLGLAGGAVASLASAAVAVTALPLAAAVAAGAALAGSGRGKARPASALPVRIYAVAALLALAPLELARWRYDQAAAEASAGRTGRAEAELAEAARLDPAFPLYPARLALLRAGRADDAAANAELALRAARQGAGVQPLWLIAGVLGYDARRSWAAATLDTACALDPFGPFAPFYRMLARPGDPGAAPDGAQALLAEPRLAAAVFWARRPGLLAGALPFVRAWPGVDAAWKDRLLAAVPPPAPARSIDWLVLDLDAEPEQSVSLNLFRRRRWPIHWPLIQLRAEVLPRLSAVPSAPGAPGTSPRAFASVPCRLRSPVGQALLSP